MDIRDFPIKEGAGNRFHHLEKLRIIADLCRAGSDLRGAETVIQGKLLRDGGGNRGGTGHRATFDGGLFRNRKAAPGAGHSHIVQRAVVGFTYSDIEPCFSHLGIAEHLIGEVEKLGLDGSALTVQKIRKPDVRIIDDTVVKGTADAVVDLIDLHLRRIIMHRDIQRRQRLGRIDGNIAIRRISLLYRTTGSSGDRFRGHRHCRNTDGKQQGNGTEKADKGSQLFL